MEIKFNAKDFLEVLNKIKHIARFDKSCPMEFLRLLKMD